MEIDGQGAVVVGGMGGLGEATARHLAALGADVTVLDIDGDQAARLAAEIGGYSQQCDITEEEAAATGITSAMARFGQAPRIVINCGGIGLTAPMLGRQGKVSTKLFRHVMNVNVVGAYHVMSYAAQAMMDLPPLESGERGIILNAVSLTDNLSEDGRCAVAASRGALAALCLPAARDLSGFGIRVMTIEAGAFESVKTRELGTEAVSSIVASIPFPNRLGNPQEFARLVEDIVRNPYLNGTSVRLDAGRHTPS